MKTLLTLLAAFSAFYIASSCNKGDTKPGPDFTHYNDSLAHNNDSIKHIADSMAHYADSVFNSPYGTYYGNISSKGRDMGNDWNTIHPTTFIVMQLPNDSIFIGYSLSGSPIYNMRFPKNTADHYIYYLPGSYWYKFESYVGKGSLSIQLHEGGGLGSDYYTDDVFSGKKKHK